MSNLVVVIHEITMLGSSRGVDCLEQKRQQGIGADQRSVGMLPNSMFLSDRALLRGPVAAAMDFNDIFVSQIYSLFPHGRGTGHSLLRLCHGGC